MARTNQYISEGGEFENLSDAMKSIDSLLSDLQTTGGEREDLPQQKGGFRQVISELQKELLASVSEIKERWQKLEIDPLYVYTTEEIAVDEYSQRIKFLYPIFENVWLTEGKDKNVAAELLPFIDYGLSYHPKDQKLFVSNIFLETQLNLPDFKASLEACYVDLEVLRDDTKQVARVFENGEAACQLLNKTLSRYCSENEIALEIERERIPFSENEEDRASRIREKAEVARRAEREAKKRAEEEERRKKREEAQAALEARAVEAEHERKKRRERHSTPPPIEESQESLRSPSMPPPIPSRRRS